MHNTTTTSTQTKPLITAYYSNNDKLFKEGLQLIKSTNKDDKAKGYFYKALHYIKTSHYSLAQKYIEAAIQLNRSNPVFYSMKAELLATNGNLKEAHKSAQQAVILINAYIKHILGAPLPKFSYSLSVRAKISLLLAEYYKQHFAKEARENAMKAMQINHKDPTAQDILQSINQMLGEIPVVSPGAPQVQPPSFGNAAETLNATPAIVLSPTVLRHQSPSMSVPQTTNTANQQTSKNHSGQGGFTVGNPPNFASLSPNIFPQFFQSPASQQTPQQITDDLSALNATLLTQISHRKPESNRTSHVFPTSSTPGNNPHSHLVSTIFKHPAPPLLPLPQPNSSIPKMSPTTQPHSKTPTITAATSTPTRQQLSSTAYPIKKEPSETASTSQPGPKPTGQQHSYNLRKRKRPQEDANNPETPIHKRSKFQR